MNLKYYITENELETEDGRSISTYGIGAGGDSGILAELRDVSTDPVFTTGVVDILNSNEVELCHFRDVVLDELNR